MNVTMKILSSRKIRVIFALIVLLLYAIVAYKVNEKIDAPLEYHKACAAIAACDNNYILDYLSKTDQYNDFIEAENNYLNNNDTTGLYAASCNIIIVIHDDNFGYRNDTKN